jgi:hypothetical protein
MTKSKANCWEVKQCGREPGAEKALELGVCQAAVDVRYFGLNGGLNAGRYCWRIAGTFCDGTVQGVFAEKALTCSQCDFFKQVVAEEGPDVKL